MSVESPVLPTGAELFLAVTKSQMDLDPIDRRDLRFVSLSRAIVSAYSVRLLRPVVRRVSRLEGGAFFTGTIRRLILKRFGVYVGAYSYGPCLSPGVFPPGVVIGRYVSIAADVRIFLRNHPMERLSLHPFFYNAALGFVLEDNIPSSSLTIGHDAWVGERTIITPGCARIGIGAVVGAGSVVTKDVPDFAVVAGNPARIIRMRFSDIVAEIVLASRWWEHSAEQCRQVIGDMIRPLGPDVSEHPLLRRSVVSAEGKGA